jgi:HPt (histidine-containing phosphotransfer) domain-containing protein
MIQSRDPAFDATGEPADSEAVLDTVEKDLGPKLYRELHSDFLALLPTQVLALQDADKAGDLLAARFVAHQLSGTAPSFGARALNDLAVCVLGLQVGQGRLLSALIDEIDREVVRLRSLSRG